jgi:quinol monooxygenase YgiN
MVTVGLSAAKETTLKTGLTVIAYVRAKPGHEDSVRSALLDLVAHTRTERGCINYDLHESEQTPGEFAIYENWKQPGDLDMHAKSDHLQEFRANTAHRLERASEITRWRMLSELAEHVR